MEVKNGSKLATLVGVKKDNTFRLLASKAFVQHEVLNFHFNSHFNFPL